MRFLLRALCDDAASADRAAETAASLVANGPTALAAATFAATIVGGIFAIGLCLDIAMRGAL